MSKKNTVKIIGEIASWNDNSADSIIERIESCAATNDVVELHIHSVGGSVFEGNLIYNAIAKCNKPVHVYVDGLAASMASIIMSAGTKIFMAENAFIMVHAPSTYVQGNADEMEKTAKMLRSMEGNFLKVYQKRTGKKEEELRAWFNGDNWFDAQDALKEKLIDGIVDKVEIKIEDPQDIYKDMTLMGAFSAKADIYENYFTNTKKQKEMDKKSLIAKFGLSGLTEQSTDAEIEDAIQSKLNASDAKVKEMQSQQIKAAIDAAVSAKKVNEAQRKNLEAFAEVKGIDALSDLIKGMNATQPIFTQINTSIKGGENRSDWDWEKWQKEDPRGLEKLKEENAEMFNALYLAKYGNKN